MRRRRRNPTEAEKLIDRLQRIADEMIDLEPEPESDDEVLQDLIRQKREIEREIEKHRKQREKEKARYKQLERQFDQVEAEIKRLDPDFDGL